MIDAPLHGEKVGEVSYFQVGDIRYYMVCVCFLPWAAVPTRRDRAAGGSLSIFVRAIPPDIVSYVSVRV